MNWQSCDFGFCISKYFCLWALLFYKCNGDGEGRMVPSRECSNVQCFQPDPGRNCSISTPSSSDGKGPLGECCDLYVCDDQSGSHVSYSSVRSTNPAFKMPVMGIKQRNFGDFGSQSFAQSHTNFKYQKGPDSVDEMKSERFSYHSHTGSPTKSPSNS